MEGAVELVRRVVAGERAAWPTLQHLIQPTILAVARSHRDLRRKGFAQVEDELSEIATSTLERLARDDFKNLRRFLAALDQGGDGRPTSFDSWLYGATDFAIREHLRRRFGRAPAKVSERLRVVPSKRDLQTGAGRLDQSDELRVAFETLKMTTKLAAGEIWAFAERTFSPLEVRALRSYFVDGATFGELASSCALDDAADAERMIRRLTARLRYHFLERAEPRDQDGG